MNRTSSQAEALLAWMDALGDPTRLRLLRLLERHELGVGDLCDILQLPQSTVSRHLKTLAEAGWLQSRRQGTVHLYRMILDELEAPARRLWLVAREQTDDWATLRQDRLRLAQRLRSREADAQRFFAGAAADWERLRGELYGVRFVRRALLALLPADYVVADLGCGSGDLAAELAPAVGQVIAVDSSPAMLKAARQRLAGSQNVDLRRGDLHELPVKDQACHAALLMLALSYVAEPQRVLREAQRILQPGGKLVVVDLLPHDRDDFRRQMGQRTLGFATETVADLLGQAGFAAPAVHPLEPEPDVKGPALFLAQARRPTVESQANAE